MSEPFFTKPQGPVIYQYRADKDGAWAPAVFSAVVLPERLVLGDWAQKLDAEWRAEAPLAGWTFDGAADELRATWRSPLNSGTTRVRIGTDGRMQSYAPLARARVEEEEKHLSGERLARYYAGEVKDPEVITAEKPTVRTVRHAVKRKRVKDSNPFPPDTR